MKTAGAMEEDIESMHVESSPDKQSGADLCLLTFSIM